MFLFKRSEGADAPVRAHKSDAGYDVTANSIKYSEERQYCTRVGAQSWFRRIFFPKTIPCYITVDTGLAIQPGVGEEDGTFTFAFMNSRGSKRPVGLGNCVGIIDAGYTGTIKLIFKVCSWAKQEELTEYFQRHNVVGQLIVTKTKEVEWVEVESLERTDRSDNGFGSTEKLNKMS